MRGLDDIAAMNAQSITITRVGREADSLIENLFGLYLHDMAEWFLFDIGADGRYHHDMARYRADGSSVYLARVGETPAGFALVGPAPGWFGRPLTRDLHEFFVLRRHRRTRLGETMARTVWDSERGRWLVRVFEGNRPAVPFWRTVVGRYTDHTHRETRREHNGRPWACFTFANDRARR